ncbi:MAG: aspartate--ammonia ligase [Firmicutes bacterium]|jgi:aspartate--ammonia ligase|nr:aspartate--ammonia ligase [Bacillota bacterium]
MKSLIIPENYASVLDLRETERAIKAVKDGFERSLAERLNLERITAPLFLEKDSGLNDDLNGVERKVEFELKETKTSCEVVQSLAKWKRMALYRYGFKADEGLYTDMNAIRRDDDMDNIHSVFVDQWDWERVITKEERNLGFLKMIVQRIVDAVIDTHNQIKRAFPALTRTLDREIFYITAQELEDKYPRLSPKEREYAVSREHHTVFLMQIGGALKSGIRHDGRAPDYDDWTLNGDLLFWNDLLNAPLELSSMGIRVDAESLKSQLELSSAQERMKYEYHRLVSEGVLPLTIGGGIGQSRICMLLLEKLHIGEVQASYWGKDVLAACKAGGVDIL